MRSSVGGRLTPSSQPIAATHFHSRKPQIHLVPVSQIVRMLSLIAISTPEPKRYQGGSTHRALLFQLPSNSETLTARMVMDPDGRMSTCPSIRNFPSSKNKFLSSEVNSSTFSTTLSSARRI